MRVQNASVVAAGGALLNTRVGWCYLFSWCKHTHTVTGTSCTPPPPWQVASEVPRPQSVRGLYCYAWLLERMADIVSCPALQVQQRIYYFLWQLYHLQQDEATALQQQQELRDRLEELMEQNNRWG